MECKTICVMYFKVPKVFFNENAFVKSVIYSQKDDRLGFF